MNRNNNYNEIRFVICCSKIKFTDLEKNQVIKLIGKLNNWEFMYNYSRMHNVSNLIYNNVTTMNLDKKIPSLIYAKLRKDYNTTLMRNIWLWAKFKYLQRLLENAKIQVTPFKGIILMNTLYRDPGLRTMIDIDVLVKEKDLLYSKNLILNSGYQMRSEALSYEYRRKFHCHLPLYNQKNNLYLELHWAPAPPRPEKVDLTEVWQRARVQKIDNQEVLTLSLEDTLLSLCINICRNIPNLQFILLKNLVDINELISQYKDELDSNYIINKVIKWRIKGCFYYLYKLTKNFLETPWTEEIIQKIYPQKIQRKILDFYASQLKRRSQTQAILLIILMLDRFSDVFRLIYKLISQAFSIFLQNKRLFSFYLKR